MTTLFEKAYAKLNLTLDIIGKREDGYHDLKSVMQTVSFCDDVEITLDTGEEWKLTSDSPDMPCDERNLAWKAAKVFFDHQQIDPNGIHIHIVKRLPSQAGMGGGSADAAAVLRALNRHYGYPLTMMELADLGATFGSDVPFCVVGGTCMCEGRGEILTRLPAMPRCTIVGVKPPFPVSTPFLFKKIDSVPLFTHPDNDAMVKALEEGDIDKIAGLIYNVFDPVVAAEHPEIDEIKAIYASYGALGAQMTGSGSACFAIVPEGKDAEGLRKALKDRFGEAFLCYPV